MNTMNRGSLRTIRQTICCIDNLLIAIINTECEKECGGSGGAPTEAVHGSYSDELKEVSEKLEEAIDQLDEIVDQTADWEEYLE